MWKLRVKESDADERTVAISRGTHWRVGRANHCEVRVSDLFVSGEHAELSEEPNGAGLRVKLTRGANPILVEGKSVTTALLADGDSFMIGKTRFTLEAPVSPTSVDLKPVADMTGTRLVDTLAVLGSLATPPAPKVGQSSSEPKRSAVRPAASSSGARVVASPSVPTSPAGLASPADIKTMLRAMPEKPASVHLLEQLARLAEPMPDLPALQTRVLEIACSRVDATRGFLARVDPGGNQLKVLASVGFSGEAPVQSLVSTTVLHQLLERRQAVLIGDTADRAHGFSGTDSISDNHIKAVACVPVLDEQSALCNVLYLDNQERLAEFSAYDAEFLIWLGHLYRLLADNLRMRRKLEAEVFTLQRKAAESGATGNGAPMVAEAPCMQKLLERADKAAQSEANVLILGETGAGKECLARFIHYQSTRAKGTFVARNCSAIPENLFESEMFGHVKGAFTGAASDRKGAFSEAHGGTLFLDEIGDMGYAMQTKLLRVIQERVVRPLGGSRDVAVDVRIVCATNRNLKDAIRDKTFRDDLYYRVGTVVLMAPPLRDRREDILKLARHFTRMFSGGARELSERSEAELLKHNWPGNVRELLGVIQQAVIFSSGARIEPDELNLNISAREGGGSVIALKMMEAGGGTLAEMERRHILRTLKDLDGNRTEAARVLGIARSTLILKLKEIEKALSTTISRVEV